MTGTGQGEPDPISGPPSALRLGAVILGAGASRRMGRPKLLLPWDDTTVLGHLVEQWKRLGARQCAVVIADGDPAIHAELNRLGFPERDRIVNSDPARGMHSSIRCAAEWPGWNSELTHWAIVLGDQPHLRPETLSHLLRAVEGEIICQPSRGGRGRHPVILARRWFQELRTSTAETLKQFLTAHAEALVKIEIDDPGLDLDMDRPEDYEAVRGRWVKKDETGG